MTVLKWLAFGSRCGRPDAPHLRDLLKGQGGAKDGGLIIVAADELNPDGES